MGLDPFVAEALRLGYRTDRKAITWPEMDDQGEIVGIGALAFLPQARRLSKHAKGVWTLTPPENVKDIREWFKADENAVDEIDHQIHYMRSWTEDPSRVSISPEVLEDTAPLRIADQMIAECYTLQGESMLRYWNGLWYEFMEDHYGKVGQDYIRADVYR